MKTLRMHKKTLIGVSTLALSLALLAGPASAVKKGPRASVSVATVCAIDGSNLEVEIRVTDKTSGDAVPVVTGYVAKAVAKTAPGNWQNQTFLETQSANGWSQSVPKTPGGIISSDGRTPSSYTA